MDRGATAQWTSNAGTVTTDSGALINAPFSAVARYELEAKPSATTPEEMLAAAYASCFTTTLAERLTAAGSRHVNPAYSAAPHAPAGPSSRRRSAARLARR